MPSEQTLMSAGAEAAIQESGRPINRHILLESLRRMALFPSLVAKVRNWPRVIAARLGWTDLDAVRFRDGSDWKLLDLRPGLAILREIYFERAYDAPFRIDPAGTVVDVGANIGVFTVVAARKLVPRGQVIAIEPNPEAAAVLRQNLENNGIENVRVIEAAASTQDGQAQLYMGSTSLGASTCSNGNGYRSLYVRTVDLSKIINATHTVDLLKLDIEGAEWPILFDPGTNMWKKIMRIAMEYHLGAAVGKTPSDLAQHLIHLGFRCVRIRRISNTLGYLWAEAS
jgi:FkbM family methyltransferase